jgi:hypothetical protein
MTDSKSFSSVICHLDLLLADLAILLSVILLCLQSLNLSPGGVSFPKG